LASSDKPTKGAGLIPDHGKVKKFNEACLTPEGFTIYKELANCSSANILYQRENSKESVQGSFAVIAATQHQSDGGNLLFIMVRQIKTEIRLCDLPVEWQRFKYLAPKQTNVTSLLGAVNDDGALRLCLFPKS
jgi:hypothetical protein